MREFEKIETVFNRDTTGSKKLIEGDYRNETVEYLKDNKWVWTEKIDGTNTRIIWDGHSVSFAGHTDNANVPQFLIDKLTEMFGGSVNEELFEQKFGATPVILYGEGYGPKIQKGGLYRSDLSFILFDVFIGDLYLKREDVEDIAKTFNIDAVPIIFTGAIDEAVAFVKTHPKSTIGNAPMEGVVGRPMVEMKDRRGNRIIVKVKVKDFC